MNSHFQPPLQTLWQLGIGITGISGLMTGAAFGQSISIDGTTPSTTIRTGIADCPGTCIEGGFRANATSTNLFHSFDTFNVNAGETVTFKPSADISNIFSRVTNLDPLNTSNILGTLGVNGSANLFLLNPNGIIFGNDAQLSIQGDFLASTANSVLFQNGTQFSAAAPASNTSLLTVSTPIGLQFGSTPNPITVQGNSGRFIRASGGLIGQDPDPSGLTLNSGSTLALVGGGVNLIGANLSSLTFTPAAPTPPESGQIEIGSVGSNAFVGFNSTTSDLSLDYSNTNSFGDIQLSQGSSLDVSGSNAGQIRLQGRQISFTEGSTALAQINDGGTGSGHIFVNASEQLDIVGIDLVPISPTSASTQTQSGIYVQVGSGSTGNGNGNIDITTPLLALSSGGEVAMGMGGEGSGGNINVYADTITADGGSVSIGGRAVTASGIDASVLPIFTPAPGATGQGGNVNIDNARSIQLTNGSKIATNAFGEGDAGNIVIRNAGDISVSGQFQESPAAIASTSRIPDLLRFGLLPDGSGSGGNITIETERLNVTEGGQVSVGTRSINSAGKITIEASDAVTLQGNVEGQGRSGIFANGLFRTGAGGDIKITTPSLSLLDGATINASNFPSSALSTDTPGSGPSGNIEIDAASVLLADDSVITTNTVSGDRANINITSEGLVLRRGSRITTNATGDATGGNITLTTDGLIALENSDITANAEDNFGGRIIVNANTILGTAYREQLSPESDITASSALGPAFSGSVELNSPDGDPTNGLESLPEGMASADQIVAACEQLQQNTFVATGRGGLPTDASQPITGQTVWNDFRIPSALPHTSLTKNEEQLEMNIHHASIPSATAPVSKIVEAETWTINSHGEIMLGTGHRVSPQLTAQCLSEQASS